MQTPRRRNHAAKEINETPIFLTPDGIEQLRTRYTRLKKALPDLAAEAARTAAYGDRSDNAEYKQAKGALRYTQREIYRLEDQFKRVVAIKSGRNAKGTIQLGSVVVLAEIDEAKSAKSQKIFEILGPDETNPGNGRISNQSPLGVALMNRVAGDVIMIKTGNGERTYRIVEVK